MKAKLRSAKLAAFAVSTVLLLLQGCSSHKATNDLDLDPSNPEAIPAPDAATDALPASDPSRASSDEPVPQGLKKKKRHRTLSSNQSAAAADPIIPAEPIAAPIAAQPDPTPAATPPPVARSAPRPASNPDPVQAKTDEAPIYMNRNVQAGVAGFFLLVALYFTFKKKRHA